MSKTDMGNNSRRDDDFFKIISNPDNEINWGITEEQLDKKAAKNKKKIHQAEEFGKFIEEAWDPDRRRKSRREIRKLEKEEREKDFKDFQQAKDERRSAWESDMERYIPPEPPKLSKRTTLGLILISIGVIFLINSVFVGLSTVYSIVIFLLLVSSGIYTLVREKNKNSRL